MIYVIPVLLLVILVFGLLTGFQVAYQPGGVLIFGVPSGTPISIIVFIGSDAFDEEDELS